MVATPGEPLHTWSLMEAGSLPFPGPQPLLPTCETAFPFLQPRRWMEFGPAGWPLRASDRKGHKTPRQMDRNGDARFPEFSHGVWRGVWRTRREPPFALGSPPKHRDGFSLWERKGCPRSQERAPREMSGNQYPREQPPFSGSVKRYFSLLVLRAMPLHSPGAWGTEPRRF